MDKMEMTWVEISKLKPAKYNPRDITPEAMSGLQESIKQFGLVDPLIRNIRTGNLVGGHQRLKAAKLEGLKKVPVVDIDVDENREKAINIVLNNSKISGHYTEALSDFVTDLQKNMPEIDFDALKFDLISIQSLIVSNSWDTNFEVVNGAGKNLDGIKATIVVQCMQEDRGQVIEFLKDKISKTDFKDVVIK